MVWNSTSPNGAVSVKQNTTPMQQNTTYTETTLNNDHFWNIGVDEDGHHQWANMVATNDADTSLQTNASLATGMDGNFYARFTTATESVNFQDCLPYFINNASVLQILGIRAAVLFNFVNIVGAQTMLYTHNVASVSRLSTGKFFITYTAALPSASYLVFSGGIPEQSSVTSPGILISSIERSVAVGTNKTAASCTIITGTSDDGLVDPLQAWLVCFGG